MLMLLIAFSSWHCTHAGSYGLYAYGMVKWLFEKYDTGKRKNKSMSYEENVRRVVPYTPGEQPGAKDIIKLNTNENPYPPCPGVERVLRELEADKLRLYPDPGAAELVEAIAQYHGVESNQVFVGVGSDDVLAMAFMTFFNGEKPILFPDITYSFYDVWADLFRIPYRTCPLSDDFQILAKDYETENGGIIFPNPNAPTGVLQPLSQIEEIVKKNPDVVVMVDEAYIDFGGESSLQLLSKYENLLVIRTFSKSRSLAGLRIGYAIGSAKMIGFLNDVKFSFNSYTMNTPTIRMGVEAVKDDVYFRAMREKLVATRERSKKALEALGFSFPDSMANFIFARHESVSAEKLFSALKERGIYVRYFKKPRIDNYLRITIGTEDQMDVLFKALEEIIGKESV